MVNWVNIPQFAKLRGITEKAVRLGIDRHKYQSRVYDGELQVELMNPTAPASAGIVLQQGRASSASALLMNNKENNIPTAPGDAGISASLHTTKGQERLNALPAPHIPEAGKAIALARLDLLRIWEEYRTQDKGRKAATADKDFSHAYNSGLLAEQIYKILGKVSVKTLYRWRADLESTRDWTRLVPKHYNRSTGVPKLTEQEARIFMGLLLHPNKIKVGTAVKLTKYTLEKNGTPTDKSQMTFRRFADWFQKNYYDRWVLMREGQKALLDKVAPFIKRDPSALDVGDVLVADGHRLNFKVINPFTGKPCRATLVGYVDWKSYDLVGYEIMVEENTQCIASALRNSILRLGKIPKVTYQDNGKAFRARFFTGTENLEESGLYGLFGRLGIVSAFARPYNARAKIIERWFKDFSDTFERLSPSFIGASIEDQPAWMKRNEKFHRAMHNEYVPTISEAIQMIEKWFDYHRSLECPHVKGKTIGEVFNEGRGEGIAVEELDDLMMAVKKTEIRRNGIRFLHADYYDDNLYGLRDAVLVKYSLFDLSHIKVYSLKGEPLCIAHRVEALHPMAHHLGTVKDAEELSRKIADHRRLIKQTVQVAKGIAKSNKPIEFDWQKTAGALPGAIDKIEAAGIPLPGDERRIPDEILSDSDPMPQLTTDAAGPQTFNESWQRYEYLIKQTALSTEDRLWLEKYEKSNEYIMLYGTKEAIG